MILVTEDTLLGATVLEIQQFLFDISECNRALADASFQSIILGSTFENTDDIPAQIWAKVSADVALTQESIRNMGFWATRIDHTIAEEGGGTITCNRPLYDREDGPARSNTQIHERCHMPDCGYSHRSATDYESVPYKFGNLMEAWLRANPKASTDST